MDESQKGLLAQTLNILLAGRTSPRLDEWLLQQWVEALGPLDVTEDEFTIIRGDILRDAKRYFVQVGEFCERLEHHRNVEKSRRSAEEARRRERERQAALEAVRARDGDGLPPEARTILDELEKKIPELRGERFYQRMNKHYAEGGD